MIGMAKRAINEVIEDIYPDIVMEVKATVQEKVRKHAAVDIGPAIPWYAFHRRFRALVLYHMAPFDKDGWYLKRDPLWWLMTLIASFPFFCVRPAFFLLVLVFIVAGRPGPDEFQLVKFIQKFKGFQFLSGGVIKAIVGAVEYFMCVTPELTKGDDSLGLKHTCTTHGPGQEENFFFQIATFGCNMLLVWVAFFALRCSKRLGSVEFKHNLQKKETTEVEVKSKKKKGSTGKHGGRLQSMLYYDFFCALVCIGLLFFLNETTEVRGGDSSTKWDNWQFRANMFWMQVLYSLLSFPFVIFQIPIVFSVLTHAKPTGYSPNGRCVRTQLSEEYKA